jgi:uncharacterized protein YebE (UPF0316 family)
MTEREYNAELYEKMRSEQADYKSWLLAREPSEMGGDFSAVYRA